MLNWRGERLTTGDIGRCGRQGAVDAVHYTPHRTADKVFSSALPAFVQAQDFPAVEWREAGP